MKRFLHHLPLLCLAAGSITSANAQTVFSWDVDNAHTIQAVDQGSFNTYYYDEDNLTVSPNVAYAQGSFVVQDDGTGNDVLMATSWFSPAGQADNWLVFGPITHPANVTSVFSWKHAIPDNTYRDGYSVLVSSTGPNPSSFNGATVLTSFSDNDPLTDGVQTLTTQSVTLPASVNGGPVYIAFHHDAMDQFILMLDDFEMTHTINGSAPTVDFTADVTTIPVGGTVNFTDLSTDAPTDWDWTFTGASTTSSTDQNPSNITYPTVGCYEVSLTASNSFGSGTETKTCYIDVTCPTFDVGFAYTATGLSVAFTNTSYNVETYDWNFGDGNTSIAPNPINNYAAAGTYTVTLLGTDTDCSGNTDLAAYNITVDDTSNNSNVSIAEAEMLYTMNIFPNPGNGLFHVNLSTTSSQDFILKVYNMVGQEVWQQNHQDIYGDFETAIDLRGMEKGVYLMQVVTENTHQTKRIIVK